MRILQLHNRYQIAGGEDTTVAAECELLTAHDHEVRQWQADNAAIRGVYARLRAAKDAIYSQSARQAVTQILRSWHPDIVHVHNFFPLLSPAVYDAARDAGVPVVQTLHNYRLLCPNAVFFREGHICEDCLGKMVPWPGLWHACYRQSRTATAPLVGMLSVHNWRRTWLERVDLYISQTEFTRAKFVAAGFPAELIAVKPPFPVVH
jgi:glycosyltransferase involved in cell wall biosynthesis